MSGSGQVEMSGSRYVAGHVGARPDHEQTRVRARSFAVQSAREETHSTQGRGGTPASACDKSSAFCQRYRTEGPASLSSRRRGRASNHQLPVSLRASVLEVVRGRQCWATSEMESEPSWLTWSSVAAL